MKIKKILVSIVALVLFISVGIVAVEACEAEKECPGGRTVWCGTHDCEDADCGTHSGGVWCYCDGETDFFYCPPEN